MPKQNISCFENTVIIKMCLMSEECAFESWWGNNSGERKGKASEVGGQWVWELHIVLGDFSSFSQKLCNFRHI